MLQVVDGQGHTALQKAVVKRLPRKGIKLLVDAGAEWLVLTAPEPDISTAQRAALRLTSPLLLLARLCSVGDAIHRAPMSAFASDRVPVLTYTVGSHVQQH